MLKLRVGDKVKITAGKDKGREGSVERVFPVAGKVLVPDVNMYKRHVKGTGTAEGQKGGIYDLPRPLAFAKVALICPKCKKVTRVGFKLVKDEKVRVCKKCGKEIDAGVKTK